jgi:tRNA A-37 threonylcarbamoyl transferase component Bud32
VLAARTRLAKGFSRESLAEAAERHARCLAGGPGRVLKRGERTQLTAVTLADGREMCVKEYRPRSLARRLEDLLRPAAPLREWRAAEALAQLGVPAPAAYALALPAPLGAESAYLVLESIGSALAVNRYALRATAQRRRALVDAVAGLLASLHARGVSHGDLKGSNLLVREGKAGLELFLVDLAAVRVASAVSEAERIEALAQLNASTPLAVTRWERLRFLARYAPQASRAERARWFRAVEARSRTRKCVWDPDYRGFELADPPGLGGPRA